MAVVQTEIEKDKKIQLWIDIIQDVINITCIYLLWVHVHWFFAIAIGICEFIRLGAYFKLGEKAKKSVEGTYAHYLMYKK